MKNKKFKLLGCLLLALVLCLAFTVTALAEEGEVPAHSKAVNDNGDGTLQIELTVTGDADTEQTEANANVLIVFDTSWSMSMYNVPSDTGSRGEGGGFGNNYVQLYKLVNNQGVAVTDAEGYTGTVYVDQRCRQRDIYTGQRYMSYTRADKAEQVMYDFANGLFTAGGSGLQMALIPFNASADTNHEQEWTDSSTTFLNNFDSIGSNGTTNQTYNNGTNWESAMRRALTVLGADSTDSNPTFVIFVTDGEPRNDVENPNAPSGVNRYYYAAIDEAYNIENYDTATHTVNAANSNTTLYTIYAYGREADYLDDLMYYALNHAQNPDYGDDTTSGITRYFNAGDDAALKKAIDDIFEDIVETLGITDVAIGDGTTGQVKTSSGDIAELLDVDTSSYEYWMSFPRTGNTISRVDPISGDTVTYTLTDNNDGITIAWGTNSIKVKGELSTGIFKYKWESANAFYNFNPPDATYTNGKVDWDLEPVGTLLDGVTYSITFDVWPSQTTLDYIADLKNGVLEYIDPNAEDQVDDPGIPNLDPNIAKYIEKNGNEYALKTNTGATLSYTDTRNDEGEQGPVPFRDPDAVATKAVELMTITKDWSNMLDGDKVDKQPIDLQVLRGDEPRYTVHLDDENHWQNTVNISIGILHYDEGKLEDEGSAAVTVNAEGHDFSFAEPEDLSYQWELDAPIVRPMLINGGEGTDKKPTMLKKVTEADIKEIEETDDVSDIITMLDKGKTDGKYFPIKGGYYVKDETVVSLKAENNRRSYLDLTKAVSTTNPDGDLFTFNAKFTVPADASDEDKEIWFAVKDGTGENAQYIDGAVIQSKTTATREQKELDKSKISDLDYDSESNTYTYTYKETEYTVPAADNGAGMEEGATPKYYTNYFYFTGSAGADISLQEGWDVRFINLLSDTEYTIKETLPTGDLYSFVSSELTTPKKPDGYQYSGTTKVTNSTTFTGKIDSPNVAFMLTYTNKYEKAIVVVEKTFSENIGEAPEGFYATVTYSAGEGYTGTVPAPVKLVLPAKQQDDQSDQGGDQQVQPSRAADGVEPDEGSEFPKYTWTIDGVPTGLNVTVNENGYETAGDFTLITDGANASVTTADTLGIDKEDYAGDTPTAAGAETKLILKNNYQANVGTLTVTKEFDIDEGFDEEDFEDFAITVAPKAEESGSDDPPTGQAKAEGDAAATSYELAIYGSEEDVPEGIEFTGEWPNYTWTIENVPAGAYTVTESGETLTDYDVETTYEVGGEEVEVGDDKPAEVAVTVGTPATVDIVNEYAIKTGTLIVTKEFQGFDDAELVPTGFAFTITPDGEGAEAFDTLTLDDADTDSAFPEYTWTVEEVPVGTYVIEEDTATAKVEGYTLKEDDSTTKVEDVEVTAPTNDGTDTPATADLVNVYEEASGGTLKIVKIVTGSADVPADAEFTITGEGLEEAVVVYFEDFVYDEEQSNDTKDVYVYEYPEELPAGNYTVTEKAATAQVPGYSLYLFGESGDSLPMTEDGLVVTIRNDYHLKSSYVPEELNGEDHYAYMIGYPDGLVHPERNITRAEVATIFFRLLTDEAREANLTTVNTFGDVNEGQWFNVSISTMANMGIVNGYPDGDFHPNDNITRAEFAAIAARFDKEAKDSANIFTDIDGHWAKSYILRAVNRGWINGYPDSTFRPDRLATRAEVAAMVNRVLVRDPEDPDDLLPDMIKWPDNMDTRAWYYLDIQEATNTHEYERQTKPTEVWMQMLENPDWTKYQY